MLQSNKRRKNSDARALPSCQRGLDTLSHGLLEVIRLASWKDRGLFTNMVTAGDVWYSLEKFRRLSASFDILPESGEQIFDWVTVLREYLEKQELFCSEKIP